MQPYFNLPAFYLAVGTTRLTHAKLCIDASIHRFSEKENIKQELKQELRFTLSYRT